MLKVLKPFWCAGVRGAPGKILSALESQVLAPHLKDMVKLGYVEETNQKPVKAKAK